MKNNNKMRHAQARHFSLLAVCVAVVMAPAVNVMADSTSELMMFAEMSGQRPVAPAPAPVRTQPLPVPVAPASAPPAPAVNVARPVITTPAQQPIFAERQIPAAAITQPVQPSAAPIAPAAIAEAPQQLKAVERAATISANPSQPAEIQGGGFLTEEQRRPEPKPFNPLQPARNVSQPQPAQTSTYAPVESPQANINFVSTPSADAAVTSPVTMSGGANETVAESEIRQKFLSAARITWRISPSLKSYIAQGDAAEASVDEAKGQRWPQVDVSAASATKEFGSGTKNYEYQGNTPSLGVSVATNLIDFGQTSRTIESREERVTSALQSVQAQREDLAMQVSNALIEWNKQQHVIAISKQYLARMAELTKMLSGIVQSDTGRRSELTQAKGRLLQAQSYLENAESRARDVEITLNRLMGNSRVTLPASDKWALSFGDLNRQLTSLDVHPLILRASAEERAAFKEAEAIKASGLPKLNWTVSKNTREDQLGRQQAWQTGLNVSWGLFRGGSTNAQEIAAIKRAEASRQQVQEQRRDLENRVRAASQNAHSTAERAVLYKNLIVESDRIRKDFFDQWYHLGRRSLLDVLSAESDLYNNQVSEVSNRFDSYAAIISGYANSGTLSRWLTTGR
ncbi:MULTISPECIES: TolC family protein [unclassified Enterobacter]|uniref:TolC family protein n=1 Tax=unclassified Enterobacter TaxID=2608935 RepID=UPI0015CC0BBA|nr:MULTISPECIES: TolC family protein [unclassified Enterobacter]MBB3306319.1 adhesin transport system outer membrane protein [Enterobacter sp. Sphag1F]NYI15134.1 adhesin transport system outer membrane protein [Enterobacter sp. Sphag71]